ncbi:MAG: hypothetical protein M0Z52_07350 [Actinomycetota bacterium]|nr:hypothetical protein [Actinomycetota bacterium]
MAHTKTKRKRNPESKSARRAAAKRGWAHRKSNPHGRRHKRNNRRSNPILLGMTPMQIAMGLIGGGLTAVVPTFLKADTVEKKYLYSGLTAVGGYFVANKIRRGTGAAFALGSVVVIGVDALRQYVLKKAVIAAATPQGIVPIAVPQGTHLKALAAPGVMQAPVASRPLGAYLDESDVTFGGGINQ